MFFCLKNRYVNTLFTSSFPRIIKACKKIHNVVLPTYYRKRHQGIICIIVCFQRIIINVKQIIVNV